MPKTEKELFEGLKRSAANKAAMLQKFGVVPLSVLKLSRGKLQNRMLLYQGESVDRNTNTAVVREKASMLKKFGVSGNASSKHCGRAGHLGLSSMPAELVDFFIKYYSAPGQMYLDPFGGQGIRMQTAKIRGLNYIGYDLCKEFWHFCQSVKELIDDKKTIIEYYLGDSKHPDKVPENCGDFSFHSPPYWDIEFYGDNQEQLGTGKTYPQFLVGLEKVMSAWLPKFKRGAWHVVNINDFRKEGVFYPYHSDYIQLSQRAGWRLHDVWIVDQMVCGIPKAFAVDFNLKRIAPKTHEYALVFRKP